MSNVGFKLQVGCFAVLYEHTHSCYLYVRVVDVGFALKTFIAVCGVKVEAAVVVAVVVEVVYMSLSRNVLF